VLCFTNSGWGLRFRAKRIVGTVVTSAPNVINQIRKPGPIEPQVIAQLARELSFKLPAST